MMRNSKQARGWRADDWKEQTDTDCSTLGCTVALSCKTAELPHSRTHFGGATVRVGATWARNRFDSATRHVMERYEYLSRNVVRNVTRSVRVRAASTNARKSSCHVCDLNLVPNIWSLTTHAPRDPFGCQTLVRHR